MYLHPVRQVNVLNAEVVVAVDDDDTDVWDKLWCQYGILEGAAGTPHGCKYGSQRHAVHERRCLCRPLFVVAGLVLSISTNCISEGSNPELASIPEITFL